MRTISGLPTTVRDECEAHLTNGHLDDAVLTALKWVESCLSWSTGRFPRPIGVDAVRYAIHPDAGTLRFGSNREQEAVFTLLKALMQIYRNPAAHGFPVLAEEEARAVVDLADAQLNRIARGLRDEAATALGVTVSEIVILGVADLDGDAQNEMLVAALGADGKPKRIAVLKKRARGFLARVLLDAPEGVVGVETRDVDQDGRAEVLLYDSANGPGVSLSIIRWSSGETHEIARIGADLPTFTWSQPDGDGKQQLVVRGRVLGEDAEWRCESRTFRWTGQEFAETNRAAEPWGET